MTDTKIDENSPPTVEECVLGSMINSPERRKIVLRALKEDDFSTSRARSLFSEIRETEETRGSVDITLLAKHIEAKGKERFESLGGYPYLAELGMAPGVGVDIDAYIDELRQHSVKRTLLNIQRNIGEDLARGIDSNIALDRLETKIRDLKANKPHAESAYRHLLDPISEKDIVEEIRKTSPGVSIGFKIGDIYIKVPGGALTIVAGPTGQGKTLVLINFILNFLALYPDKKVFFFSYEESRAAILSLFLNTYINEKVSNNNRESIKSYFRDGNVQFVQEKDRTSFLTKKEEFFKTLIETQRLNIFYSDSPAEELIQAIRFIKNNVEVGLVGIDYVQLLSLQNKKTIQRQEELKQICLMMKNCAVDTGLPILLAAQFNRAVIHEASMSLTAIGEAGDIERAANMVIGIWNRNCEGLSKEGNLGSGTAISVSGKIPKESAIYMEILKGREAGTGHALVFDLNGNTGKLVERKTAHGDTKPYKKTTPPRSDTRYEKSGDYEDELMNS